TCTLPSHTCAPTWSYTSAPPESSGQRQGLNSLAPGSVAHLRLIDPVRQAEPERTGLQIDGDADLATVRAARTRWHVDVESERAPQQRVSAHARAGYAEVPSSSQSPCDPALGTERCVKAAGVRAHLHAQPRRCQEPQGHGSLDQGLTLGFGILHVERDAMETHAAEKSDGRYPPDVQHLTGCRGGDLSLVVLARDHWPGPGDWRGRGRGCGRGRRPGRRRGRGRRRWRGRGGDHGRDLDRDPWGRRRWNAAPRLVVEPSDFR